MRRSGFKGLVAAAAVAASIAGSTSTVLASDIFLKLGTIKGESQDDKHKGEIDVLAWSWGQSSGSAQTKKGPVPVACIQDLQLTKLIDSSSPDLIMMGVTGQVVPSAVLTLQRPGELQGLEFFILRLTNVTVPSYQVGGDDQPGSIPLENIVVHFDTMQGEYRPQRSDGSLGQAVVFNVGGTCKQ